MHSSDKYTVVICTDLNHKNSIFIAIGVSRTRDYIFN